MHQSTSYKWTRPMMPRNDIEAVTVTVIHATGRRDVATILAGLDEALRFTAYAPATPCTLSPRLTLAQVGATLRDLE